MQLVDRLRRAHVADHRLAARGLVATGPAGDRHGERTRVVLALDLDQSLQRDLPAPQLQGGEALEHQVAIREVVPEAGAGAPAAVGPAQLPGRQPPHVRRHTHAAPDRAGRGLADRDERRRQGRQQPALRLLAGASRAAHALDVPACRPLRLEATRPAVEDHAAVRLPVVRRTARRVIRRRPGRPGRNAARRLLRGQALCAGGAGSSRWLSENGG